MKTLTVKQEIESGYSPEQLEMFEAELLEQQEETISAESAYNAETLYNELFTEQQ